jgi:hypothetical protein
MFGSVKMYAAYDISVISYRVHQSDLYQVLFVRSYRMHKGICIPKRVILNTCKVEYLGDSTDSV